jgi:Rhodopirellula transposase DDE domain
VVPVEGDYGRARASTVVRHGGGRDRLGRRGRSGARNRHGDQHGRKGRDEARRGATPEDVVKVRRSAGKRPYEVAHPEVWPALENLIDPITRGDPESPPRWTCKSTHALSAELFVRHGIRISHKTVAKLLRDHGYSLQAPNKSVEGAQHPDRNAHVLSVLSSRITLVKRG